MPSRIPILAPLAERDFRVYWAGRTVLSAGDYSRMAGLSAVAFALTGKSSTLANIYTLQWISPMLFLLFGGWVIDRFHPRSSLIAASLAHCALLALLLVPIAGGWLTAGHLYAYAILSGFAVAFFNPADQAIRPELLPTAKITPGNALLMTCDSVVNILVSPLAASLLVAAGAAAVFGVSAVSLLVIAVAALAIRRGGPRVRMDSREPLKDIGAGLRAVWSDPVLAGLTVYNLLVSFCYPGSVFIGLPALANLVFKTGPKGLGALMAATGAGGLMGALIMGAIGPVRKPGLTSWVLGTTAGVLEIAAGLVRSQRPAVVLMFLSMMIGSAGAVLFMALMQSSPRAESRGRGIAVILLAGAIGNTAGYILAGWISDALGPRITLVAGGLFAVAAGLYCLSRRATREAVIGANAS